jgi:hypothetical protein
MAIGGGKRRGARFPRPAFELSAAATLIAIDLQPGNTLGPVARRVVVSAAADAHPFAGGRHRVAVVDGRVVCKTIQDGNNAAVGGAEYIVDFVAVRSVPRALSVPAGHDAL